jgi:Fe-S cluster assembly scaffold protein SufB
MNTPPQVSLKYIPIDKLPVNEPLSNEPWVGTEVPGWINLNKCIQASCNNQWGDFAKGQSHELKQRLSSGCYSLTLSPDLVSGRVHLSVNLTITEGETVELMLHVSELSGNQWADLKSKITVEKHAHLKLTVLSYTLQSAPITSIVECEVLEYAQFDAFYAVLKGSFHYQSLAVQLHHHARSDVHGLILTNKQDYRGFEPCVEHRGAHTASKMVVRTIAQGPSKTFVHGLITVHPGAKEVQADYLNHNLMLSDKASVIAQPELDIEFDDLACSHGVTLGSLDDQALFYLQSRGIPLIEAKVMLIESFAQEILGYCSKKVPFNLRELFIHSLQLLLD